MNTNQMGNNFWKHAYKVKQKIDYSKNDNTHTTLKKKEGKRTWVQL